MKTRLDDGTPHCGVMLDLARERRFHLPWTLELIRDLPRYGTNELHLYLENRFAFPSLPGVYPAGSLTPAQARALQAAGARVGVRVVPHLNVLGHNENLLRRVEFQHLRAERSPQWAYQLNPRAPAVRRLLAKQIRDVVAVFDSPLIHVGGDETSALAEVARRYGTTPWQVYLDQMLWVHRELQKHGRQMGLWGDMMLHYPELLKKIPKDVLIFDWFYYGRRPESLRRFRRHGFQVVAATATLGAPGLLPGPENVKNELLFWRDAQRLGIRHHLATCWELMHGTCFATDYAVSLPVQLAASGSKRPLFAMMDRAWWKAQQTLAPLQLVESLTTEPADQKLYLTWRAAGSLNYMTHPFVFLLTYGSLFDQGKVRRRLEQVRQWQRRVARLKPWRPTGPLRYHNADLIFQGRQAEILIRRLANWAALKTSFENGQPRLVATILEHWQRDYEFLAREFRRREQREGYGPASRARCLTALRYLKLWQKQLVREAGHRTSHCLFEVFLESIGPADWRLGLDRPIHPCDL